MLECLIIGDSIAKGVSDVRKECVAYVKSGINSHVWLNKNVQRDLSAKTVIISLGTNDLKNINTYAEISTVRKLVDAQRVYWIMPPIKPDVQQAVRQVAGEYGDTVLPIQELGSDGVHPTYKGYKQLGDKTK